MSNKIWLVSDIIEGDMYEEVFVVLLNIYFNLD